jgi:hypothetical protein
MLLSEQTCVLKHSAFILTAVYKYRTDIIRSILENSHDIQVGIFHYKQVCFTELCDVSLRTSEWRRGTKAPAGRVDSRYPPHTYASVELV